MKKVILLFLFLASQFVSGQEFLHYTERERLWEHVEKTPIEIEENPQELVSYLSKAASNERELIEIIYYWIADNIQYDVMGYTTGNYEAYVAEDVLTSKTSVCGGYSNLFKLLCDYAELECVTISGYAKGFGYSKEEMLNDSIPNHAWNAVKLDGNWKLIDSTWGSGYVYTTESGELAYKKSLSLGYIFSKPEGFILEHFPEDPNWQLLNKPLNWKQFYSDSLDLKIPLRDSFLR